MTGTGEHCWQERIAVAQAVLAGKPVIRCTRIAVEQVLDLLAAGWTVEQLLDEFPDLTEADIRACLSYAAEALRSERVYPVPR
jgi:uncharacterized protein (DUF433 family)